MPCKKDIEKHESLRWTKNAPCAEVDDFEIDYIEHDYIVKNAKTLDTGVYWQPLFNSID